MLTPRLIACLGLLGMLLAPPAMAGISLSATRVVFDGAHKEANVTVRNGGQDVLIQSWIDSDDDQHHTVPFAVTPPLARVMAKQQQLLRILYEGTGLPQDRESVVWLNVQEIPQASEKANTLQLAVRQRIKVFFRPAGLPGDALQAPTELGWRLTREGASTVLSVTNPSLYHVSMADLTVTANGQRTLAADSAMIAPGQTRTFALAKVLADAPANLSFRSINDYGAQSEYHAALMPSTVVKAKAVEPAASS
ncbi:Chaperone protein fimC precursor [Pseudomonas putida]|nr:MULTISPECIES: molecular chaperone [Pseudomonas]CAB5519498.1 Chaperone protein fimC precursor [Pseudomonas putida]MBH3358185.1 molecular chaperone [Pseudomonas guariconensis]MDM9594089.1 molecular chaperone [Pseudomonas guariconensis]MDM9606916.1 molecular chaperone [Pseudomonas guariconensis]MDM9611872.1 molecular chaperone [Pseudomonas guariconensis]